MDTYEASVLGFAIVIINPVFKEHGGMKVLQCNWDEVARRAFPLVIQLPTRLTGGHIKFIREHLQMNQTEFARKLKLKSHSQVSRWESKSDEITNMEMSTEILLRMMAYRHMGQRMTNEFSDFLLNGISDEEPYEVLQMEAC